MTGKLTRLWRILRMDPDGLETLHPEAADVLVLVFVLLIGLGALTGLVRAVAAG